MSDWKEEIKYIYILFMRFLRKPFCVLPIHPNRIIFESFAGEGFNCNPKYISKQLRKDYGDRVEIIWAFRDPSKFENEVNPKDIVVRYRSFRHFLYRITSHIYVCNFLQAVEIPKPKKQIEIQTWHGGGGYKNNGIAETARKGAYVKRQDLHLKETDYFISSCKLFSDKVIRNQFGFKGAILECGMPRNDCLIHGADQKQIARIRMKLGISENKMILLYAPTWRYENSDDESINFQQLSKAVEKRFGKECVILYRAHLYGNDNCTGLQDVTEYPDMQELLLASDILVTDYSSSIWDYSFTGKPCFLYVPDLEYYIMNRGFITDINTWGFPVCPDNESLQKEVLTFDEDQFRLKMEHHHKAYGSFEKGTASKFMSNFIGERCGLKSR